MTVRGWCPGALRPMMSGDGLVLRIRPHAGRLTAQQARALADLSRAHGNGLIDLGTRAHLQLRGVREGALPALHAALADLGLLDKDAGAEARRNILTTPIHAADETLALVAALEEALADAPALPPKFGFAVDSGARAVLGAASADIRIERAERGLILRADGMALGVPVTVAEAPARAVALAQWFAAHRGAETRMARLIASGTVPLDGTTPPLPGAPIGPGPCAFGLCLALPFGQIAAADLHRIAVAPLRLTPWRSVIVEGTPEVPDTLIARDDPLLRIHACTGAPGCASASVETRALARRLAPLLPEGAELHISGCAKGCAHPGPALTLTGHQGRFGLIPFGPAGAQPVRTGLTPDDIPDLIRGHFAPPL
ncbi:hypothetical protein [Paenirhodobacter sp.]|uniref:hypothetical protein n=1 Tax=Paenirhodobacter sp. TaxID=1965326 RepID=UPI003B3F06AE